MVGTSGHSNSHTRAEQSGTPEKAQRKIVDGTSRRDMNRANDRAARAGIASVIQNGAAK